VDSLDVVRVSFGDYEEDVQIDHLPWHSYDFDFASLNFSFRHLIDPEKSISFGIADIVFTAGQPKFEYKGIAFVKFEQEEERHETVCRRYRVDGPGLENRGGLIWVDKELGHIVDYEIALPDEPGFDSGKLRLKSVEKMDWKQWDAFMQSRLSEPEEE
jgi:hypothetical protein